MSVSSKEKVLIFDGDRCTGCSICELTCSMAKHGEYNPRKSYIKVLRNRELDVNIVVLDQQCDGCNQCVVNCIAKAIKFVTLEEAAIIRKQNRLGTFPVPMVKGS